MEFEWDSSKEKGNFAKHGVAFKSVRDFDWDSAITREDIRNEYGEQRFVSMGFITGRLHVVTWTPRVSKLRLISLRKANKREEKLYDQT